MAVNYEKAGVNLEAGYEVVRRIKQHVASTQRLGTMGNIGAFGGMFDLASLGVKEPVLVSGTDGVGTKLKIAFALDKQLKRVDFPTFGNPTMPHCKAISYKFSLFVSKFILSPRQRVLPTSSP